MESEGLCGVIGERSRESLVTDMAGAVSTV